MSEDEAFVVGDAIWVTDAYDTKRPAVVESFGDRSQMYATSADRIPGDSRSVEWVIPVEMIPTMVSKRGGNV